MSDRQNERPLIAAFTFVVAVVLLAGTAATQMPRDQLTEIIQTTGVVEAGLDPISIGLKAPTELAQANTKTAM